MLRLVALSIGVLAASWGVMIVLARRLPQGLAKDLATVLPACVTTVRRLRKDPLVPAGVRVAVAFAGLWVLSPIDLIPEFIPVIGPIDDIVVVALVLRYTGAKDPTSSASRRMAGRTTNLERLAPSVATYAELDGQ